MNLNKLFKFTITILGKDWGGFEVANIFTILGFALAGYLSKWGFRTTLLISIGIFIIIFILKIIKQFYSYFDSNLKKLKIESIVSGEEAYAGNHIIKLEYSDYLQKDMLLTVYSGSTGISQPICILRIISIYQNDYILAIQFMPDEGSHNISAYYSEEVRKKSLFAVPAINYEDIQRFQ